MMCNFMMAFVRFYDTLCVRYYDDLVQLYDDLLSVNALFSPFIGIIYAYQQCLVINMSVNITT